MIQRKSGKIIQHFCSMYDSELGRKIPCLLMLQPKGGLKCSTRNMAHEWAKHNISGKRYRPWLFATGANLSRSELDGHPD